MKPKRAKTIYAARISLSGLYYAKPLKCTWDPNIECWVATEDFDICVDDIGEYESSGGGCITFSSTSKDEVASWIDGAMAALTMLKRWATGHKNPETDE